MRSTKMTTKKLMVITLVLGVFASGLIAKETSYEPAKKPELALNKSDLDLVAKAIKNKFKGLSKKDKEKLSEFLSDYTGSAKHEIIPVKPTPTDAKKLKVSYEIISIEPPFSAFLQVLKPIFKKLPVDATEENIQARSRGILLMAISNKYNKLVLTTGNKSEISVGYATLYGDMAGGYSPLKDVWKTLVYQLAKWRNKEEKIIPENIINRPPTAELRNNQLDQDTLPDYEILDPILEQYIEFDKHPEEIVKNGYDAETVYKIVNLVDKNEYKRRQAAPGVKITKKAFGKDRRYPISSGYIEKK